MHCQDLQSQLDDYLDGQLSGIIETQIQQHAESCAPCREALAREQAWREQLRDLAYPPMRPEFTQEVLAQARAHTQPAQPAVRSGRWSAFLGGALAASLTLWALLLGPLAPTPQAPLQQISMTTQASHQVQLAFNAPAAFSDATLELHLPEGLALSGREQVRQLKWQTQIRAGVNLLPLELIATETGAKTLLVRIHQADQHKEFQVQVQITGTQQGQRLTPVPAHTV